ncbi:protein phosphatase 2C domain-containing protein [Nakamurella deserti]|uniref:protein phosphatase 2C domain-containing protein n=1 Tax=Nakamurella deserti TaxID=2164074 RepID=UPI000DBE1B3D|nr:protein phosphatase 2C domain-containing protein [Nakamurella deserti]
MSDEPPATASVVERDSDGDGSALRPDGAADDAHTDDVAGTGRAPAFPVTADGTAPADTVGFGFNLHRVLGQGEDADPLLRRARDLVVVGVFDGMGGAGGTVYETPDGPRTGAYLASRVVRDVVDRSLDDIVSGGGDLDGPGVADQLHAAIGAALKETLAALHAPRSALRSRLIRALPTTMAVAVVRRRAPDSTRWDGQLFWAGDSRVYLLEPARGAAQLTPDDLRDPSDAMANLRADSVLSNAISADVPFVVHSRRVDLTAPFLLVAATDGAFGYLPSPMHFEHLLLTTLRTSEDVEDWSVAVQRQIAAVTGDDAALAVVAVGADHTALRDLFAARGHAVENDHVRPLDAASMDLRRLELELEILRNRHAELSAELWSAYRGDYERHLSEAPAEES